MARGYADTRIADVAEHAGTSPALVIYYFKTRDQLLTEALRYSEDALVRRGHAAARRHHDRRRAAHRADRDDLPAGHRPGGSARNGCSGLTCGRCRRAIPGVATVRRKFDERWRETISTTVLSGQESGEFSAAVDAGEFAVTLSALLDGMAVQIALEDPDVPPSRAYDLAMRYAAGQLGFTWDRLRADDRSRRDGVDFMAAGIELVGLTKRFGHRSSRARRRRQYRPVGCRRRVLFAARAVGLR